MLLNRIFILIAALLLSLPLSADDEEEAGSAGNDVQLKTEEIAADEAPSTDAAKSGTIYIPLKPPFVVNYGGPGRLKYIKADLSVRLTSGDAANSVRHHMPYIRNNLLMLFSAQTDETISSQAGKEALRQEALREIQTILKKEDQIEGVVDLYFNSFILQK